MAAAALEPFEWHEGVLGQVLLLWDYVKFPTTTYIHVVQVRDMMDDSCPKTVCHPSLSPSAPASSSYSFLILTKRPKRYEFDCVGRTIVDTTYKYTHTCVGHCTSSGRPTAKAFRRLGCSPQRAHPAGEMHASSLSLISRAWKSLVAKVPCRQNPLFSGAVATWETESLVGSQDPAAQ